MILNKNLIIKELDWIHKNRKEVVKTAKSLYFFKINQIKYESNTNIKYYKSIMPFKEAINVKFLVH